MINAISGALDLVWDAITSKECNGIVMSKIAFCLAKESWVKCSLTELQKRHEFYIFWWSSFSSEYVSKLIHFSHRRREELAAEIRTDKVMDFYSIFKFAIVSILCVTCNILAILTSTPVIVL